MLELSLILPIHNEEEIIEPVFIKTKKALDKLEIEYECILIENGSSDHSLTVIKKLAQKYQKTKVVVAPKGYGSAVLAGLKVAQGKYVGYMPSDGQVDLKVFPKLWQLARRGRWKLVKIRRVTRENLIRLLISYTYSLIVKLLFGISFLDINGSPRIFLKKHLQGLNLQSLDSFIDTEFAVKAHHLGWQIKEIPMKSLPRLGGKSTRSWRTFLEFFYNLWQFKTSQVLRAVKS